MEKNKSKKVTSGSRLPSTLILLLSIVLIAGICSYILPAGSFERAQDAATGRMIVVPGTYSVVEKTPVSLFDMVVAIPKGFGESISIMALCLIIGGALGIINETGAITAGLSAAIKNMTNKKAYLMIAVIMLMASFMGYAYGAAELMLPFIPLAVAAAITMGFDSMVGVAIILLGAGAGFIGTSINGTTVVIAQTIAGLPVSSGMGLRNVAYVIFLAVAITYVIIYAKKIKKNPEKSCMIAIDKEHAFAIDPATTPKFNGRHKAVLASFAIGILILVYCIVKHKFSVDQISGVYIIIGAVCGIVGGMKTEEMATSFVAGAKDLLYGALVIGTARAISVVLTQGNILDTITYGASMLVQGFPPQLTSVGMFIVQSLLNVLIPSGSGQAVVTMPIMAPLADLVGITRQTSVLAYQYGDAITNLVTPTSGYFMAALAMCNISWEKWIKWFLPLLVLWGLIASGVLVYAATTGFGPF